MKLGRDEKMILGAIAIFAALAFGIWLYRKHKREGLMEMVNNAKDFFGKLLWSHQLREDAAGSGKYDPELIGGSRPTAKHHGVDLIASPGTTIFSPMDAKVTRKAFPYYGDTNYEGILLDGIGDYAGYRFKIFYMLPDPGIIGKEVYKGQAIGVAQAISQKYPGQGMRDHIHVEFYALNEEKDPTPVLFPQTSIT